MKIKPITCYNYVWDDDKNQFFLETRGDTSDVNRSETIFDVMDEVESESGIKRRSNLWTAILVIIFSSVGFLVGFFLILYSMKMAGGAVLTGTPIVVFFTVVGYEMLQMNQVSRFNLWMKRNELRLIKRVKVYGTSMTYSINKGNLNIFLFIFFLNFKWGLTNLFCPQRSTMFTRTKRKR